MTLRRRSRTKRDLTLQEIDVLQARAKLVVKDKAAEAVRAFEPARAAARRRRAPLTPLITWGESGSTPDIATRLVIEDGTVLEIPARRGWGGSAAIVDWLSFTCHEEQYVREAGNGVRITDEEVIREVSYVCESIFGFGISAKRDRGLNFYKRSYVLGDDWGFVCHGGQRGTVNVILSGTGLAAAADGWEARAVEWFKRSKARITRIDLAYDDFEGLRTVDDADRWDQEGRFSSGGRPPQVEHVGAWRRPSGKGRTLYIGNRKSGKFLRVYEKGRQLGDKNSKWNRWECEYKSSDYELPYDMLLKPGEYLAAAYPCLDWIQEEQQRLKVVQRQTQIVYQKKVDWVNEQVGPTLWLIAQVEGSIEAAWAKVVREGKVPRCLTVPDLKLAPRGIHHDPVFALPPEVAMSMAFN